MGGRAVRDGHTANLDVIAQYTSSTQRQRHSAAAQTTNSAATLVPATRRHPLPCAKARQRRRATGPRRVSAAAPLAHESGPRLVQGCCGRQVQVVARVRFCFFGGVTEGHNGQPFFQMLFTLRLVALATAVAAAPTLPHIANAFTLRLVALASAVAAAPTLPHIVHLMVDDFGWADVGFHARTQPNAAEIKTPNIDALAASVRAIGQRRG